MSEYYTLKSQISEIFLSYIILITEKFLLGKIYLIRKIYLIKIYIFVYIKVMVPHLLSVCP